MVIFKKAVQILLIKHYQNESYAWFIKCVKKYLTEKFRESLNVRRDGYEIVKFNKK